VDVLRARAGHPVVLFDGAGQQATGMLKRVARRAAVVEITSMERRPFELAYRVTLAVAVGKQHRHAYLIEKCTELGVSAIQPLMADRSVTRPSRSAVEKWQRRAIESAKQSDRAWVPKIALPKDVNDVVDQVGAFSLAAICDVAPDGWPLRNLLHTVAVPCDVLCLVGPEGGWTDDERDRARRAGIVTVRLAPTTLRTETAAVAVCAAAASASIEKPNISPLD